ncbi:aromatic ring-hydroxylating dioxygenase subunit alpha [Lusitaniella coriacea LEGE 07157]|uniref:Aromatic ring-hydroxylating dioxygenase subunit alpha n=1 Tax=Lusitaniella coriacea LEGE 07157 TaxID=945747 RepID=A0A8J7E1E5_9CYAN|nr:aromatic ring-hydroxylating dioxygenase subunit alpha [Lusitaniella coriacea]MBE9118473.1 aromatic ring-hydroxylating dioxygenase subunit alpha [Lusitaniella coriacea LEGE 07157]
MQFEDFWYVVALSQELKPNAVLSRTVLGEWLAIFRGDNGEAVALQDRCLHRNSRLSRGNVRQGMLSCPYHGWVYDKQGKVVSVPSEGDDHFNPLIEQIDIGSEECTTKAYRHKRCAKKYETREQEGYVYVRLAANPSEEFQPFSMPYYGKPGWETVRVINHFQNTVINCAENFIDIPHTVSVHPGIFRTSRKQKLEMTVERKNGAVLVKYQKETNNLGWYARFLNPKKNEIKHTDSFYMPNVTSVEYNMGNRRRLFITSQSIPETEDSTLVYTDVTFNYGIWNKIARPFVRWTAQKIIRQDIEALAIQGEAIKKYGTQFANTPADTIHVFVESIFNQIARKKDPRILPNRSVRVSFWV